MKRVVLTGGTGLIGRRIADKLIRRGDELTLFTRNTDIARKIVPGAAEYVYWGNNSEEWTKCLSGKDAVIHLAGENIFAGRWNDARKKNILKSRVDSTSALVRAIASSEIRPQVFISASAVGYYGSSEAPVDEETPAGNDFLAEVVSSWENESKKIDSFNIRRVNIRTGIVLDKSEGALARMITPYRFFIGGPLGSGEQWFPWIHIEDAAGIYLFALDNENVEGVLNAVSPEISNMKEFCRKLGAVMHRPSMFKVPAFVLRIMFGEAAEVLLNGAHVIPRRTIEAGYVFKYEKVKSSLTDLLK
jgi:uncharacterized protein (TIGR01777 family)